MRWLAGLSNPSQLVRRYPLLATSQPRLERLPKLHKDTEETNI